MNYQCDVDKEHIIFLIRRSHANGIYLSYKIKYDGFDVKIKE